MFPCVFALGKAAGGVLCDYVGYPKTILAIFLLGFFALQGEGLIFALLLAFAFNLTMPLTLRLLHRCAPARPGLTMCFDCALKTAERLSRSYYRRKGKSHEI